MNKTEYEFKCKEENRKVMRAYAGFKKDTAIFVSTKFSTISCAWLIIVLFAISIPSTIAYSVLARITRSDEKRNHLSIAMPCGHFAFVPSILAIALLFGATSHLAAVVFIVGCVFWYYKIIMLES